MRLHDSWRPLPGRHALGSCRRTLEAVAFWVAALFPLAHLLFFATVRYGEVPITGVLWLAAGHALALVVGHRYDPATEDEQGEVTA